MSTFQCYFKPKRYLRKLILEKVYPSTRVIFIWKPLLLRLYYFQMSSVVFPLPSHLPPKKRLHLPIEIKFFSRPMCLNHEACR